MSLLSVEKVIRILIERMRPIQIARGLQMDLMRRSIVVQSRLYCCRPRASTSRKALYLW